MSCVYSQRLIHTVSCLERYSFCIVFTHNSKGLNMNKHLLLSLFTIILSLNLQAQESVKNLTCKLSILKDGIDIYDAQLKQSSNKDGKTILTYEEPVNGRYVEAKVIISKISAEIHVGDAHVLIENTATGDTMLLKGQFVTSPNNSIGQIEFSETNKKQAKSLISETKVVCENL